MLKYIVKRFVQMIVVLFVVSILVFMLTNFIGDPVDMLVPENATVEQVESARARLGLDKPLPVQYGIFLKDVLHGNFGKSYTYGKPAMGLIMERMPATLELVAIAALLVLLIAIPLGVYAGAYPKRRSSKIIMSGSILGISLGGHDDDLYFRSHAEGASGIRAREHGKCAGGKFKRVRTRRPAVHHPSRRDAGPYQCGHYPASYQIRNHGEHAAGLH